MALNVRMESEKSGAAEDSSNAVGVVCRENRSLAELLARKEDLVPDLQACVREAGWSAAGIPSLKHPLVYAVPYTSNQNALLNEMLRQKRAAVESAIRTGRMQSYVVMHERPYRADAIIEWIEKVPQTTERAKLYWETVAWAWCDSENVLETEKTWKRLWLKPPAGYEELRHLAMNEKERIALEKMPELIDVWHGEELEGRGPGWSWTTDKKVAYWFARRFGGSRRVYKGKAPKEKVMAYMAGRGESEVLIVPKAVRGKAVVGWA